MDNNQSAAPAADVEGLTDERIKEICEKEGLGPRLGLAVGRAIEREVLATRPSVDLSGLTNHDIARVIFKHLRPSPFAEADWDRGAVLGAGNAVRSKFISAAKDVRALLATKAVEAVQPEQSSNVAPPDAAPVGQKRITRLDLMSLIRSQFHRAYASAIDREEIDTKYMAEIEDALRAVYADAGLASRFRVQGGATCNESVAAPVAQEGEQSVGVMAALKPFADAYADIKAGIPADVDPKFLAFLDRNSITPAMKMGDFRRAYEAVYRGGTAGTTQPTPSDSGSVDTPVFAPGYEYPLPFKVETDKHDVVHICDADGGYVMDFNTHTQRPLSDKEGLAQERKAAEEFASFIAQAANGHAHLDSLIAARVAGVRKDAEHPDDIAVDRFASEMKAKMAKSRAKGRGGWDDPAQCSVEKLASMLVEHVEKGDPVDIANFSMMVKLRGGCAIDVYEALAVFLTNRQFSPTGTRKDMTAAIQQAYGYLWHVNAAKDAPLEAGVMSMTPESAAYEARKKLRDLLTHEQRGKGINDVCAAMASHSPATSSKES